VEPLKYEIQEKEESATKMKTIKSARKYNIYDS
jgi:hypothetical protein